VHQAVQHASYLIGVVDDLSDLLSSKEAGIAGDEGEGLGLGIGAVGDFQKPYAVTIAASFRTFGDGDPKTFSAQVVKVRERFGLKRVVYVGDRGMITNVRIREDLAVDAGLDTSDEYPGERLVVCRYPLRAVERHRTRQELLAATEADLQEIAARITRSPGTRSASISMSPSPMMPVRGRATKRVSSTKPSWMVSTSSGRRCLIRNPRPLIWSPPTKDSQPSNGPFARARVSTSSSKKLPLQFIAKKAIYYVSAMNTTCYDNASMLWTMVNVVSHQRISCTSRGHLH
jgi:hypothetical protein